MDNKPVVPVVDTNIDGTLSGLPGAPSSTQNSTPLTQDSPAIQKVIQALKNRDPNTKLSPLAKLTMAKALIRLMDKKAKHPDNFSKKTEVEVEQWLEDKIKEFKTQLDRPRTSGEKVKDFFHYGITGPSQPSNSDKAIGDFLDAIRFLDEQLYTPWRNVQVFAKATAHSALEPISVQQLDAYIDFPVFDIALIAITAASIIPGIIIQYRKHKDAVDMLNWYVVRERLQTLAPQWFPPEKSTDDAAKTKGSTGETEDHLAKEERYKALNNFIAFVHQVTLLKEYNQKLYGNKYSVSVNYKTLDIRLEKTPNNAGNVDDATGDDRDEDHDSSQSIIDQPTTTLQPEKTFWRKAYDAIESTRGMKILLALALGFAGYGMGYWLISMTFWLLRDYGGLHLLLPHVELMLAFTIPLIIPVVYWAIKLGNSVWKPKRSQQQENDEKECVAAYVNLLHIANFQEIINQIKATHPLLKSVNDNNDKQPSATAANPTPFGQQLAKLKALLQKKRMGDIDVNTNSPEGTERLSRIKQFFDEIKGRALFTARETKPWIATGSGILFAAVLSSLFIWVVTDLYQFAGKIHDFIQFSKGIHIVTSATPGFIEGYAIVASIAVGICLLGIAYCAFRSYFGRQIKDDSNATTLTDYANNKLGNEDVETHFTNLTKQVIQKQALLKTLTAKLADLLLNDPNNTNTTTPHQKTKLQELMVQGRTNSSITDKFPKWEGDFKLGHDDQHWRNLTEAGSIGGIFLRKGYRRGSGFIEGAGTGFLITRILFLAASAIVPKLIPADFIGLNIITVLSIAICLGLFISIFKAIFRDHLNGQQARHDRFVDQLEVRRQYLQTENDLLDLQINALQFDLQTILDPAPTQPASTASPVSVVTPATSTSLRQEEPHTKSVVDSMANALMLQHKATTDPTKKATPSVLTTGTPAVLTTGTPAEATL